MYLKLLRPYQRVDIYLANYLTDPHQENKVIPNSSAFSLKGYALAMWQFRHHLHPIMLYIFRNILDGSVQQSMICSINLSGRMRLLSHGNYSKPCAIQSNWRTVTSCEHSDLIPNIGIK